MAAKGFSLKVETRRFEKFTKELTKGLTSEEATTALTAIALEFLKRVIQRTPKDTSRAAAGWLPFMDAQGVSLGLNGEGVAEGRSEGEFQVRTGARPRVVIINRVPYIFRLEFGHSKQAPNGMVRITMREMRAGNVHGEIAAEEAGKVIRKAVRKAR